MSFLKSNTYVTCANHSPIHLSETTRMKYWGGRGSNTGTKNLIRCSSSANLLKGIKILGSQRCMGYSRQFLYSSLHFKIKTLLVLFQIGDRCPKHMPYDLLDWHSKLSLKLNPPLNLVIILDQSTQLHYVHHKKVLYDTKKLTLSMPKFCPTPRN